MRISDGEAVVSVVIPCLNEEEPIAGVVAEVQAQGVDEVIVVDNGSTDATTAHAQAAGARVVSEPRRGYGRAGPRASRRRGPMPRSSASSTATAATCRLFSPRWSRRSRRAKPISSWARGCADGARRAA